jgi:starch-binding outer membrane protein, SusD/RagB family
MNKKILNILFFAFIITASTSCKKWLDLRPQDGITRQDFWQTKEQVQSAVIGCYSSLLGDPNGKDKPLSEYLFMWGELRADMVASGPGVSNDELDVFNVNTLPTNSVTNWSAVYRTINYCNTVIDFAPGVLSKDNTFTQAQLNGYLAEARALRALMYFYLVRTFRDVPLKLTSTSSDADLQQLPKTSADTVLNQIVTDLAFADSNAVFTQGSTLYDKGRITKYTVKAIEADVFLWMDKYQECSDACDFIAASRKFGLVAGNSGWFNTLYVNGNSNESIFEFQFDAQKLNSFYGMFFSRPRFLASADVMDQVYTIDYINDQKDIRGEGASVRTSDNTIWKYIGVDARGARAADASYAHWFVYRYADVLLMKAEALIQMGRGAEALVFINAIRARANALPQTNPNPDVNDKRQMTDFLLAERAREFAFEGKRWYDILRNAKRDNYARMDLINTMVVNAVTPARVQSALGKYKDPNSHYFPIYVNEINADPNLIQNPFYR